VECRSNNHPKPYFEKCCFVESYFIGFHYFMHILIPFSNNNENVLFKEVDKNTIEIQVHLGKLHTPDF